MNINVKTVEITSQQELDKYCPKDSRACIIGLLNGNTEDPRTKETLDKNLEVLNHVLKKYPHIPFLWIDAVCHSEVLLTLDIQTTSVPMVIVYSPAYNE